MARRILKQYESDTSEIKDVNDLSKTQQTRVIEMVYELDKDHCLRYARLTGRKAATPTKANSIENAFGKDHTVVVLLEGDKPIGFIDYHFSNDDGVKMIVISQLYTDPTLRNRGIATRLISHVYRVASNHNVECLYLMVMSGNDDAKNLYANLGFSPVTTNMMLWL